MRYLICFFLGVWAIAAQAQPTMESFYLTGPSFKYDVIELASGNYVAGFGGPVLMTPAGQIVNASYNTAYNGYSIAAIERYSDNEFYFIAAHSTGGQTYPLVGRMDSLGVATSLRRYEMSGPGSASFPGDLEITAEKSVITWGRPYQFFALKADSGGVPVWAKKFSHRGGVQFIKELPGGDLLAGFNMDTAGAVVARMDADGDFLWCKSYVRPKGMVTDCLVESDDSFIITGFTDSTATTDIFTPHPVGYNPKLFMLKLNGSGDVQWCKGYANAYTWYTFNRSHLVRALDGNYVLLADLGYANFNRWYRPSLIKLDLNGDTLWCRSVGRENYQYEVINLISHSDGGFLFNGFIWGSLPGGHINASYLFKTDSLGHLPCWERAHPVEVVELFPVDSSFTMSFVDGAIMQPVVGQNMVYGAIPRYDGCSFTTGMPPMARQPQKMKVYPNPNTGRFTVRFQDPLMAESYYSVYDALGKLLYQRPLPPGKTTEEVDLARFGSGTYVIKCTDPDGVSYERVVVE